LLPAVKLVLGTSALKDAHNNLASTVVAIGTTCFNVPNSVFGLRGVFTCFV